MSRFKVLTRIEVAMKSSNRNVLEWADFYCAMRVEISTTDEHQNYWRSLLQEVREAKSHSSETLVQKGSPMSVLHEKSLRP